MRKMMLMLFLVICLIIPAAATVETFDKKTAFSAANDFLIQYENPNLAKIGASAFDVVVMDYSSDGYTDGEYTRSQIEQLKNSPGGKKILISYLCIGEAENYRYYWKPEWKDNPPSWMGTTDPDWPDNCKVKFWDENWKKIIFGANSYLDKILAAGFDGIYLDFIYAYEDWTSQFPDSDKRMITLVTEIAAYARSKSPDFLIITSNGLDLCSDKNYLQVLSGICVEDTWYDGDVSLSPKITGEMLPSLDAIAKAGKKVFCVDFVTKKDLIKDFYTKARARGFVPYATSRDMKNLTINAGFEPD
ncbi:MAG: endo alpha-1,4 polygalactosaminidase [Candidatus Wallbacteria bacterium]|nr:endo alpha-1,4 polygalactosaminidase [Candidatus Wallbacteria bacterium]